MIYETTNQSNVFLIFLFFGLIFGIILFIFSSLFLRKNQKKLKKIIFDTIFTSIFSIFFIFLLNFFNFGKLSLALIFIYCFAILLGYKTNEKLVVFFKTKCYNHIKLEKEKDERTSKKS